MHGYVREVTCQSIVTRIRVSKRRFGVKEGVSGVRGGVRVVGVWVLHKEACYRWPRGVCV